MTIILPIMLTALVLGLVRPRLNAPMWFILVSVIVATLAKFAMSH